MLFFLYILCGCTERESHVDKAKIGTYSNKGGNEEIIILDSALYVHKYKMNGVFYSDTSYFDFSFYENEGIGRIKFKDFVVSDSAIYPSLFKQGDGTYTISYILNYRYPIWSKSQTVIRSDLDDYYTILYLQTD